MIHREFQPLNIYLWRQQIHKHIYIVNNMHIVKQKELWKYWRWLFNGCQQHVLVASPTYAYRNLNIVLLVNELNQTTLTLKINLKCHKMWVPLALIIVLPTIVLYFLYHHNKLFVSPEVVNAEAAASRTQ